MLTLDTLRYDVAQSLWQSGRLSNLGPYLGNNGWQRRHSPGNFTYAAHQAFFAGFLPTPTTPGPHPRLFASRFGGSETTIDSTWCFDEPTLPEALSAHGYHTVCIGGTGFFNPDNSLGRVLPGLFAESHWSQQMSVTEPGSPDQQVQCAVNVLQQHPDNRVFLFINFSAIHQPNWFYKTIDENTHEHRDTIESHGEALVAIDKALATLFTALKQRGTAFCIVLSDHGTAYGEDGYYGHRLAHPVVWEVPYVEFQL